MSHVACDILSTTCEMRHGTCSMICMLHVARCMLHVTCITLHVACCMLHDYMLPPYNIPTHRIEVCVPWRRRRRCDIQGWTATRSRSTSSRRRPARRTKPADARACCMLHVACCRLHAACCMLHVGFESDSHVRECLSTRPHAHTRPSAQPKSTKARPANPSALSTLCSDMAVNDPPTPSALPSAPPPDAVV